MNIPSVTILVRDEYGKMKPSMPSDKITGALDWAANYGGFDWLMNWLCRYCLIRAADQANINYSADVWIKRYQALREVK